MSGYNTYLDEEESEVQDIKGVTDEVTKMCYTNAKYPFICIDHGLEMPKHKWVAVSKMVKQTTSDKGIFFYIKNGNDLYEAGSLAKSQVKAIIDLVGLDNIIGYYSEDKELKGDRLYVLA